MFSIRIQQYSIVNRHKKTSVSSLQINNIREGFNPKNGKNTRLFKFFRCIYSIIIYQSFNIPKFIFVYFPDWGLVKYLDSFSPLLPSGNVVLEKHRETLKVFFLRKMRIVMVCSDYWLEHKPLHSELDIDWKWLYASLSSCWEIQRRRINKNWEKNDVENTKQRMRFDNVLVHT